MLIIAFGDVHMRPQRAGKIPDIRRAEAQMHAATARIGVATADLFPRFNLTGSFGFSSSELTKLGNLSNGAGSFPYFHLGALIVGGMTIVSLKQKYEKLYLSEAVGSFAMHAVLVALFTSHVAEAIKNLM